MKRKLQIIIISTFVLLLIGLSASAQFFKGKTEVDDSKYFQVDHALFESEDGTGFRLEVYYQIYNAALNFVETDNGHIAEYDVVARLFNKKKQIIDTVLVSQKATLSNLAKLKLVIDFRTIKINIWRNR